MIEIILYCPEIPQNTGNIGRICAFADCRLHLIHPLGFEISDKNLRRAGMDYWKSLDVIEHPDWTSFIRSEQRPQNIYLFTTHADKSHLGRFLPKRRRVAVRQRREGGPGGSS